MSDSRLAALDAISAVMPAGSRLLAGLLRSMAPMVNWVILDSEPVASRTVSAIELVQITVSRKISGSETSQHQGTPKESVRDQRPAASTGTPMYEIHSGSFDVPRAGRPEVAADGALARDGLEGAGEQLGLGQQADQRP